MIHNKLNNYLNKQNYINQPSNQQLSKQKPLDPSHRHPTDLSSLLQQCSECLLVYFLVPTQLREVLITECRRRADAAGGVVPQQAAHQGGVRPEGGAAHRVRTALDTSPHTPLPLLSRSSLASLSLLCHCSPTPLPHLCRASLVSLSFLYCISVAPLLCFYCFFIVSLSPLYCISIMH